jgi:hypothetical protein
VPIHIDALVVGAPEKLPPDEMFQWTNLAPNFAKLKDPLYRFGAELGGDRDKDGNPFNQAAGLEPGIHLHFRLPRALVHGNQSGAERISFPAVPNRWLVQRFSGEGDQKTGELSYKAFLVLSDVKPAEPEDGITWPTFHKDKPLELEQIGAWSEVTGPLSDQNEDALVSITAIGPGDPAFSAYYPACRGVLGFHDRLEDVPEGARLSYLVTGWYSDQDEDPLAAFLSKLPGKPSESPEQRDKQLTDWATEKGWNIAFDKARIFPARLLCHGLVTAIIWQGPDHNYMQSDVFPANPKNHAKAYNLAVGNMAAEAVAALLAPGEVDQDLLTALQGDLLAQSVTSEELQYELHERRFNSGRGGTIFLIRDEPDLPDPNNPAGQPQAGGAKSIPGELGTLLRQLNARQESCDDLSYRVEDLRWQVWALWYLLTDELRGERESRDERLEVLRAQLDVAEKALKTEQTAWQLAKKERDDSKKNLNDKLSEHRKTEPDGTPRLNDEKPQLKYRLASSPALPFKRPGDPAVAVQGPAMTRISSYVATDRLDCRTSGQEVTGIKLAIPSGPVVTVTGEELFSTLFSAPDDLPVPGGVHRSLLLEALLIDENNAGAIARLASELNEKELSAIVTALQNPKSREAQQNLAKPPNALVGRLPDQSLPIRWQSNPWIPLFMVWEVLWQSEYASPGAKGAALAENLVTRRWILDHEGCDLLLKQKAPKRAASTQEARYQGFSLLTPSAADNLADRLEALNKTHPLVNTLRNARVLAQSLDGFNDALLSQQSGIQLPPFDFEEWLASGGERLRPASILATVNDGFDKQLDTFRTAPRVTGDPFLPVRAGRLKITRLSIVDAFGQTLIVPVGKINESASQPWPSRMLRHASSCAADASDVVPDADFVELRPRFAQPMRLRFKWEDLSEKGGPVCGWVLPNHLEKSLTIYSAVGTPLGALQKRLGLQTGSTSPAFYWLSVPGVEPATIADPHLRYFCDWVLGLVPDDGASFSACIDLVTASADERIPEEDPGVSVLVGHPLALVRASIGFETAGLPAHRPELRAGYPPDAAVGDLLDTLGFKQIKWPLRLGDLNARNDGLVGVFKCGGKSVTTGGAFYPAWGVDREAVVRNSVQIFGVQDFEIDCVEPLQVTMLMDPQARIHAVTGALPRGHLELPPEEVTGARRGREVFFQTAPVLGLSDTPEMPKPSDDYGEWSWAHRPDVTSWKLDPAIVEASDRAAFSDSWPTIAEGWLKLAIAPVKILSFWVREDSEAVAKGSRIHLAWSMQGAESLRLEQIRKDEPSVIIGQWNAQPFPREYAVTVEAETTYRLTASAADAPPSQKELTVKIAVASATGS